MKQLVPLSALYLLTACGGLFSPPPTGGHGSVQAPGGGGTITLDCGNQIDFQSHTASVTGLEFSLPVPAIGSPKISLGAGNLDATTSRQASDLIEALDNAQVMYCRGLLLVAPEDRYKVLQDYSTLTVTLSTLLRNLSIASTPDQAKAAVATAAAKATTATDAAQNPPTPASPATVAAVAPAAAATPNAAQTAVTDISQAATKVASIATAVESSLGPPASPAGTPAPTPAKPKA